MATIKIDPERRIGTVDRRIFGQFIEHLGRCIYGGIFDEGSSLSDAHGFRKDVLDAARALQVPLLRWPGGNFVSGYHWTDGIGPREQRARRIELAWHSEESNRFGTDEFIEYCRVLGTEPYICVNMGSGSLTRLRRGSSTATVRRIPTGPTCGARMDTKSPIMSSTGASAMRCTVPGRSEH